MNPRCEHPGCQDEGLPCYLEPTDQEPNAHYCGLHAPEHGFCMGCGMFWGGVSSFDEGVGLCDDCEAEFLNEDDDRCELNGYDL